MFRIVQGFPDYHPEHPGAKRPAAGRWSARCSPFDELGPWAEKVTVGPQMGRNIMMSETLTGPRRAEGVPAEEMERRRIHDERGAGQGLVGRLLKGVSIGASSRGPGGGPRSGHGRGRVIGVRFESADGPFESGVRGGVIMATGGFEWDRELVRAFVRGPMTHPVSVKTNTGTACAWRCASALALGKCPKRGGCRASRCLSPATAPWRGRSTASGPAPTASWSTSRARGSPTRRPTTTRSARRSTSWTSPSYEFVNHPAWMVFDHFYLSKYGLAGHKPDGATPAWIHGPPTIGGARREPSASAAEALEASVARWNEQRRGRRRPRLRPGPERPRPLVGRPRLR